MDERYDPKKIEPFVAGRMGPHQSLPHARGSRPPEILHPRDVPLPQWRRPQRRSSAQLRSMRRRRPLQADGGIQRAASDGMGRVRTARGKRGGPERIASDRDRPALRRQLQAPAENLRMRLRLVARNQFVVARVLQVDPVVLPDAPQARPRLPREGRAMVVRQMRHGARQRAGHQRMLLAAYRQSGQQERSRAVVHQDHRLRGSIARRSRRHRLAGTDQADAAQLDRPQRRRGTRLPGRRSHR